MSVRGQRSTGAGSAPGRVAAVVVVVLASLAVGRLSAWPVASASSDAVVRLSWRTAPVRVEECRPLTEEEQAGVPAHMRRSEECTGYHAEYELLLDIDGRTAVVDTIAPSGLRRDRPVYVLHDTHVPVGDHRVRAVFTALVPEGFDADDVPVRLTWSGVMALDRGDVGLLTLDEAGRALVRR